MIEQCSVGIDYSLNSPAICVCSGDFRIEKCQFYFFRSTKAQRKIEHPNLNHYERLEFENPMQRYDQLSDWTVSHIPKNSIIAMEGYSMGSTGLIFNIAENTSILKYKLFKLGFNVIIIPPTVIKKFGSGKGNANKFKMQQAFEAENGTFLNCLGKSETPRSDIIDSYFICKMAAEGTV